MGLTPNVGASAESSVLKNCKCKATGPGVTYLDVKDKSGVAAPGKACNYDCTCEWSDGAGKTTKKMRFELPQVMGRAISYDSWDAGNYTCHGQYLFKRPVPEGQEAARGFEVRYQEFDIDAHGKVSMDNQRQFGPQMFETGFRYTPTFPEILERINAQQGGAQNSATVSSARVQDDKNRREVQTAVDRLLEFIGVKQRCD